MAAWRESQGNGKVGCDGKCPLRAAAVFGSKFQCCQSTGGNGICCRTGVTAEVVCLLGSVLSAPLEV